MVEILRKNIRRFVDFSLNLGPAEVLEEFPFVP